MQVQPYLFFNGRCEEALKFYGEKLGAQVLFQMRFSDAPPNPQQPIRPGTENKIMHSTIRIGSTELMASDGNCDDTPGSGTHTGYGLSITVDDPLQGEKTFNAMCEGGNVVMPWQATFWSTGFGMVVDKFGVMWMVTNPHEGDKHAS